MESGILTKYSASAGSGKTYRLTGIYLEKLFQSRNAYKRILAVTFTNKAASDMKRKILGQLHSISLGEKSDMAVTLSEITGIPPEKLTVDAAAILRTMLHDYSNVSIGTIDSFFQKVLRAFTREIGLQQGYIIELDHSLILARAVDQTLIDTGEDRDLKKWISEYAGSRINEGKSWNLREDIIRLANEIFKEKFRLIGDDERNKLRNRDFLNRYVSDLIAVKKEFQSRLADYYVRCRSILEGYNVEDKMFFKGTAGGVGSFLNMIKNGPGDGIYKPLNTIMSQVLTNPPVWTGKSGPAPELKRALEEGFEDIFIETVKYYDSNYAKVNSAILISENIYILGILADILDNVHLITSSENRFLLSDAGELLWLIIKNDQTPFIYEKAGNNYDHFMIDEFQDTSLIQWNSLKPLVENSMAGGYDNLVVGDVKQSIYRWRNSDWNILEKMLDQEFGESRMTTKNLETNWRSRENIISFNNSVFSSMPGLIDHSEKNATGSLILGDLYSGSSQKCPGNREGGFVRIEFIEETERKFEEVSLDRIPQIIEDLQDNGYSCSDIGILVRSNREGAAVLQKILDYRAGVGPAKQEKYRYDIISSDSLLLSASPAVCFIISLISVMLNPDDKISKALMLRNWLQATGRDPLEGELSDLDKESERLFPDGYSGFIEMLKNKPLYEAVENIIGFFRLGDVPGNTAFLNSLQDNVLECSGSTSSDASAFLEWWNVTGFRKSIILSDQQDSIRVMTIHKSKGLEFKAVIVPFASWNMGHGNKAPVMWIKPAAEPLSNIQLIPVRYKSAMQHSLFSEDYFRESYFALVDNLNLLYVAFTRAVDCLYCFCPAKSKSSGIGTALLETLMSETESEDKKPALNLASHFDKSRMIFEIGDIPGIQGQTSVRSENRISAGNYFVNHVSDRLHLRFSGEDWLIGSEREAVRKINYGKLMHEIFESVFTLDDIDGTIEKMVLEGKIPEAGKEEIRRSITEAVSGQEVRDWFRPGLRVMNESEILTVDGTTRRPDRIIIDGDRVTVIDFKFGTEKSSYVSQVRNYCRLIEGIGYYRVEGFLWYVDKKIVVRV